MTYPRWILSIVLATALSLASQSLWARSVVIDNSGADEMVITLRVELCPEPIDNPETEEKEGPIPADLEGFVETHLMAVTEKWNSCNRRFRARPGETRKQIRFQFDVTILENCDQESNPDRYRYRVHLGSPSEESGKNADAGNLWLENTSRTVAHEFGHAMGLDDEYVHNGPSRENLMGRGNFMNLEPYHLMTIIFLNLDDPNEDEIRRRRLMKSLLRMADQSLARRVAADNDITNEQYDDYQEQFETNGTQIQPGRPSR